MRAVTAAGPTKKAGDWPANKAKGVELYKTTKTLARSDHTPGGWGAEESGMRSRPGPEATVTYLAIQLGVCLAEMGPHYDRPNESVILGVKNAAPPDTGGRGDGSVGRRKPLAAACIRRDHEPVVKLR